MQAPAVVEILHYNSTPMLQRKTFGARFFSKVYSDT